jgi:AcrR family transcriptional regulator
MPARTARQDEIIQESLALIAERGMEGLTYRNLSERFGISIPAFYRHFASKADILQAVIDYLHEVSRQVFESAEASGTDALDTLRLILMGYAEHFAGNSGLAAVLFPDEVGGSDHGLQEGVLLHMEENQARLAAVLDGGIAAGLVRSDISAQRWAFVVMGSLRLQVTKWRLGGRTADLVAAVEELWRDLELILRPPQPHGKHA